MINTTLLKSNFDLKEYFDDKFISYKTEGDNVTFGWINIPCIFCEDHEFHLGINLKNKLYHCWLCDETGDVIDLVRAIDKTSFNGARAILEQFQNFSNDVKEKKKTKSTKFVLPKGFKYIKEGKEPTIVKEYMKRRKFDLSICQTYKLGFIKYGDYNLRLIVPAFVNGEMVSYQAADVTGKASIPYIDCPEDKALVPNNKLVYGLDNTITNGQVILVEGVTDKWRIGKYGKALFGKNYTSDQLLYIIQRVKKDVVTKVLFDPDASVKGREFAVQLSTYFKRVLFVRLSGTKDPADLSNKEVFDIISI